MITTKRLREMSDDGLVWTRQDLREVIEIQEATVKAGGRTDKLGEYHDDLAAVNTEIRRRLESKSPRCACGRELPQVCS